MFNSFRSPANSVLSLALSLALCCLLTALSANADEVILLDGSHLQGEVVEKETTTLLFKTSFAGTLSIKWDQVKKLRVDKTVNILLENEEIIQASVINREEELVILELDDNESRIEAGSIDAAYINPPDWKQGIGYNFSGRLNFSLKSQHGNTVKDEIDLDGKAELRRVYDRLTFTGELENDTTRGDRTSDNWLFTFQYDKFYKKRQYYGGFLSFEHDQFTDLELRSIAGVVIGEEFYHSRVLNLDAAAGIGYVDEENYEAADEGYFAGVWKLDYDNFLFDAFTQFYHRHTGRWNLEDTDRVVIKSWTGFRFPLHRGFLGLGDIVASLELEADYDSKPNKNIGKSDMTYRIKLGYVW